MRNKFYNKKMKKAIFLISFFLLLFVANFALSQGVNIDNPLRYNSIEQVIGAITDFVVNLGFALASLMIAVGVFMLVTSAGNTQKLERAKKILMWTGIAILVLVFSKAIKSLIFGILGL